MLHVLSAALLALVLGAAHSQQLYDEPLISDTPFLDTNQFNPSGEREREIFLFPRPQFHRNMIYGRTSFACGGVYNIFCCVRGSGKLAVKGN